MPYFTKKGTGKDKGKTCVHKKSSKKKVGCTSGPIEKYLTALRMAESKEDPLKWIKDVKTNNDIAKELYDGLEWYKEENIDFVRNQWNGIPFSVRPFEKGRDKIILSPSSFHVNYRKYMIENLGIYEMDNAKEIYFLLRKLIAQKIHNNLNESKDFEWTDSISDRPLHNVTFKVKGYPETLYTIKDSGLRSSVKIVWRDGSLGDFDYDEDGITKESAYMRDAVNKYFKIGEWIPTEGPITESKDLDWIEDVTPRMDATLLKPGQRFYDKWGDIIRVLEYLGRDDEGEICYEPPCTLLRFRKIKDPSGYRPYPGVPMSHPLNTDMVFTPSDFNNYIDTGKLKLINIDSNYYENLNESDLDWVKDVEPEGFNKNNSYVIDVRDLRPKTPISISPTSPEYTELTKEDILNGLKDLGYDIEDVDLNRAAFLYIEPSADAGYWDGPVWVEQQYWVDWDEDNIENPMDYITHGGKYQMIDVDELMFLIDNNLISESTDFDWVKDIPLTMNTCEAYDILNPGDEIIIDAIDNWGDNPNQWDDNNEIQTFYNVKAKVLALDECSNIDRNNESNANTILVSIEENGYYGFDDLWADGFAGTLSKQCQKDNCMFLICDRNEEEYQIKLIEPSLNESDEFKWVDEIPKDYYPPDLESGLKGLEKWVGQAYQTDDEIGLSVQDVKENPSKENIQDLINVLKHWKPYHDGDEVYWAVEDLISSINPFRFRDLNNMGLFESDLGWINDTSNKIQTTGIGHDGNIISLQKVYFDFLRTIAKVENNYNPTYESQATLDTKYTRKVKDYLNLNSRDYQGLARELLHIGLDEAFKMYFDNNPQLSESDELNWVEGTGLGKVDLRDCKPGDILITRSGKTVEYVGPTEKGHYYDHIVKYNDGDSYGSRTHDGYVFRKNRRDDDEDIIHVLKEHKKTITEAAGISFEARKWGEIIYNEIMNNPNEKKRLIIDGYDHPEAFNGFPIDYVVIDFYDKLTGYGQEHSGYDKDGNYVVLLYVQPKLLQGQGGYSLKSALNHEMKHAWDDYNRLSKGLPSIDNTKETKELYNKDFILMLSDQNVRGPIKELLKYYYYLSKLETTAYLENVYDNNPVYEKIVREIASKDFESFKDRFDLDVNWHLMNTAYDIPFLKKFKSPKEFIDYSSEELSSKAIKMIKKINKMKYIHKKL